MADDSDDDNILPFTPGSGPSGPSRGEIGGIGSGAIVEVMDDGTNISVYEDGSVAIAMPAPAAQDNYDDDSFDQNLAERIAEGVLSGLAEECIEGVEADITSRADLVDQYEKGLELLGTRIEDISTPSSSGRSVSRIGHPLMTEAMVRYQAGAEAEMLPASGPAKVMTIGQVTVEEEELAQDFEDDFNYYLTEIATEYYPDTSRMLMELGYCGNTFKKIYRCAMRDRPVSEAVSMLDLIVSEEANTLENAIRVTHQIQMTRSQLRRMQIAGRYRDIDLGMAQGPANSPGYGSIKQSQGLSGGSMRPQDIPYTIWEIDVDIDVGEHPIFGKWENAAPEGLPLPYKITINRDTRQVLAVWRNWKQDDKFYRKNNMYVHYGLVPSGFGFHHWGFLQLLGNHTRALRAIWRLMVDAGMFANFPGGMKLRGARTASNEIAPSPGEWIDVDAPAGVDIRTLLMALPYKSVDAVFIQLAQMIEEGAQRLGGSVMIETGEGKANVPVGTVLSTIEQQTQIMAGVHRRTHRAQKDELRKLRELFADNPEDLWKLARDPKRKWEVGEEFTDLNLAPASDPSIPSQLHRVQIAVALASIMQMNPAAFDQHEVLERLLRTIKIADPDALLAQPGQQMQPGAIPPPAQDPTKMLALQQKAELAKQQGEERMTELQQKSQQSDRDHQMKLAETQADSVQKAKDEQQDAQTAALESADRAADRQQKMSTAQMKEETERMKIDADERKAQASTFGQFAPDGF